MPPLLSTYPPAARAFLAGVVPFSFGALAGYLLGESEPIYLVLSLLGIAGGFFAGLDHLGAKAGALRGVVGGSLFGSGILIAHELSELAPKAELPEPAILLIAITTILGAGLGALGGRFRARREPVPA